MAQNPVRKRPSSNPIVKANKETLKREKEDKARGSASRTTYSPHGGQYSPTAPLYSPFRDEQLPEPGPPPTDQHSPLSFAQAIAREVKQELEDMPDSVQWGSAVKEEDVQAECKPVSDDNDEGINLANGGTRGTSSSAPVHRMTKIVETTSPETDATTKADAAETSKIAAQARRYAQWLQHMAYGQAVSSQNSQWMRHSPLSDPTLMDWNQYPGLVYAVSRQIIFATVGTDFAKQVYSDCTTRVALPHIQGRQVSVLFTQWDPIARKMVIEDSVYIHIDVLLQIIYHACMVRDAKGNVDDRNWAKVVLSPNSLFYSMHKVSPDAIHVDVRMLARKILGPANHLPLVDQSLRHLKAFVDHRDGQMVAFEKRSVVRIYAQHFIRACKFDRGGIMCYSDEHVQMLVDLFELFVFSPNTAVRACGCLSASAKEFCSWIFKSGSDSPLTVTRVLMEKTLGDIAIASDHYKNDSHSPPLANEPAVIARLVIQAYRRPELESSDTMRNCVSVLDANREKQWIDGKRWDVNELRNHLFEQAGCVWLDRLNEMQRQISSSDCHQSWHDMHKSQFPDNRITVLKFVAQAATPDTLVVSWSRAVNFIFPGSKNAPLCACWSAFAFTTMQSDGTQATCFVVCTAMLTFVNVLMALHLRSEVACAGATPPSSAHSQYRSALRSQTTTFHDVVLDYGMFARLVNRMHPPDTRFASLINTCKGISQNIQRAIASKTQWPVIFSRLTGQYTCDYSRRYDRAEPTAEHEDWKRSIEIMRGCERALLSTCDPPVTLEKDHAGRLVQSKGSELTVQFDMRHQLLTVDLIPRERVAMWSDASLCVWGLPLQGYSPDQKAWKSMQEKDDTVKFIINAYASLRNISPLPECDTIQMWHRITTQDANLSEERANAFYGLSREYVCSVADVNSNAATTTTTTTSTGAGAGARAGRGGGGGSGGVHGGCSMDDVHD